MIMKNFYENILLLLLGVVEFPQCPSLADTIKMVQNAKWTDNMLLLRVWSQLSVLAFHLNDTATAMTCSDAALLLKSAQGSHTSASKQKRRTGINYGNNTMQEHEMLYYASVIKGQCLVVTMNGRLDTYFARFCTYFWGMPGGVKGPFLFLKLMLTISV